MGARRLDAGRRRRPREMKIEALAREIARRCAVRLPRRPPRAPLPTLRSPPARAAARTGRHHEPRPRVCARVPRRLAEGQGARRLRNDNQRVRRARVTEDFIDHKEIGVAMWLPWRELLAAWRDAGRPADGKITPLEGCKGLPDGKPGVSVFMLQSWITTRPP